MFGKECWCPITDTGETFLRQNPLDSQHAKKVVFDSPLLMDFAIGPVNFVLNLSDGQVKFFEEGVVISSICPSQSFWD